MLSVYAHWILLNLLTVIVSIVNSVFLIKQINFCSSCSRSKYMQNSAKKDVKAMAISFLVLGIVIAILMFVSKFNQFSKFGFNSRSNAARFNDVYLVLIYVAMIYNVFSFMNFAAVAHKCKAARCKEKNQYESNRESWLMAKTLNVIYIAVGASYIFYRFTCPRQNFGTPSLGTCKRVLCLNKVRNKRELEKFEDAVKKVEGMKEKDFSKKIRVLATKIPLKRENGDVVRGDQAGFYDEVLHQVRTCAQAEDDSITVMGFKSGTWGKSCSGMTKKSSSSSSSSSEKNNNDEKKKKRKEKEKEMLELYRERRKRKEREKKKSKSKSKKSSDSV